jgi:hypothetical protein
MNTIDNHWTKCNNNDDSVCYCEQCGAKMHINDEHCPEGCEEEIEEQEESSAILQLTSLFNDFNQIFSKRC